MTSLHAEPGRGWLNLGEKQLVETPWFQLKQAEIELPGGRRLDHYLLRVPPLVLTAVVDDQDRVLLLWRHRFIPDTWAFELPSGIADPAEDLAGAAARQALAESGWEPVQPRLLLTLHPYSGLSDATSHIYWTRQAIHRGDPAAPFEAERIDWIPLADVLDLVASGQIHDASTATALLMLAGTGPAERTARAPDARAPDNRQPDARSPDNRQPGARTSGARTSGARTSGAL
jgi:8-oxo-dGTP pyrophosphatase MutT (NUDIX family)